MGKEIIIKSPISGKIKLAKKINDPVFSQEMMGTTFAIVPNKDESVVVSPIQGEVKAAFPTGHAYGIQHKKGVELLVHIGIDTVELSGEGFNSKITQGSKVKELNELAEVDFQKIGKTKDTDLIIILTNLNGYKFELTAEGEVKTGDEIAVLRK